MVSIRRGFPREGHAELLGLNAVSRALYGAAARIISQQGFEGQSSFALFMNTSLCLEHDGI
jgi:hypothetical protein